MKTKVAEAQNGFFDGRSFGGGASPGRRWNRRAKLEALGLIAALSCSALLTGCNPPKPVMASPTVSQETFRSPVPEGPGDDPRIVDSNSAGVAVSASLAVIHEKLLDLQSAYRDRSLIEGSLQDVAGRLRPMIASARADCDAIRRAAKDLKDQLPIAQAGYASSAASYRQRAESYTNPDLKEGESKFASHFDVLAADTPRRLELTDKFLARLDEAQVFLAESERFLRDAETAFAVFSGGGKMPKASPDSQGVSRRLGEFISVVAEYEEKLVDKPRGMPAAPPRASRREAEVESELKSWTSPPRRATSAAISEEEAAMSALLATLKKREASRSSSQARDVSRDEFATAASTPERSGAARGVESSVVLPVGTVLAGEVVTPSHSFRIEVSLQVTERSGDAFRGVLNYGRGMPAGRRGVYGTVKPGGQGLAFSAEWVQGALSPEPISYDLAMGGGGRLSGTWATPTLNGTIALR